MPAALLLSLTAAAPAPATSVRSDAPAESEQSVPPFAETLTPELIALMQRLRVPGAIVSIRTPEWGTWTTALGTGNLADGTPMRTEDHMRVGSITKTFTGTIILRLVQAGELSLDDPVAEFRPDVPDGEHITIRQLLQMTSGLYNYTEDPDFNRALDEHPQAPWTPDELPAIAFKHPSYFPPGGGFHYSNTNTVLLGLIAEKLTGRPLAELFQQQIFGPLGMSESSLADDTRLPLPHAHGYEFIGNVESLTAPVLTDKDAAWADWSAGNPKDVTDANPSWAWAAGAAVSTVDDLLRWAPALATGTLLSPEIQRERLTFVPTSDRPGAPGYGLAIADFSGFLGHDGQLPGYNSFVGYNPQSGATIVVLANLNQSPDGNAPADELTKLILAKVFSGSPS
ncbi:serine hydrolase domain-containing protein [Embleya scabrispora]|uniref:serine hydrolase domain-containing protein n=1 Tax=Embleya scabrispora TaxID=159449 RepID=UPI00036DADD6|nr:serine hydrolase domain-containing protein [Embleya scabrispora]MYS86061.1 serine hydrolase [Streptomyces sp. SID5474]